MRYGCRSLLATLLFACTLLVPTTGIAQQAQGRWMWDGARWILVQLPQLQPNDQQPVQRVAPPVVVIRIVDAYIAPTKANGSPWDGNDVIDSSVVQAAGNALGVANPMVALAAALVPIANKHFQPPDVYGDVQILRDGLPIPCSGLEAADNCTVGVSLPKVQDNYIPVWQDATLPPVTLTDHIKLKIFLADLDLVGEDPIGTIILSASDIQTAMANGGAVTHIRIDAQTISQAYFIGISVIKRS